MGLCASQADSLGQYFLCFKITWNSNTFISVLFDRSVVYVDAAGLLALFSLSKLVKECLMQCVPLWACVLV